MKKRGFVGLAVALGITALAGVAVAHTHVAETTPIDGSTVEAAPAEVHIRFGEPEIPAPGQITDGHLEVFDACGTRVDKDDSTVAMQDSSITVSSAGAASGRYEAHWFITAADGATQAGLFDFEVTSGTPCKSVVREDPAEDVDLGFDIVKLQSKKVRAGSKVTTTFAAPVTCKALKDADTQLAAKFDTNSDRLDDITGTFKCSAGKVKLAFDDGTQTLNVTKPTSTTLSVVIPRHVLLGDVDVFLESTTDKDECSDKVCAEVAPDLGLLTVF
jgi:methionine-rich copper-binding protein CopC